MADPYDFSMSYDFLIIGDEEVETQLVIKPDTTSEINLTGIKIENVELEPDQAIIKDDGEGGFTVDLQLQDIDSSSGSVNQNISTFFLDSQEPPQVAENQSQLTYYKIESIDTSCNYYIRLRANINQDLVQNPDGDIGFPGAILDNTNSGYAVSYYLPTGAITFSIKKIQIKDLSDSTLGTYDLKVSVSVDSSGDMSANLFIDGQSSYTQTVSEDLDNRQIIFWNFNDNSNNINSSLTSEGADILSATLTPTLANEILNTYFASERDAIVNIYGNKNVISTWKFDILSADPEPNSIFNRINEHYNNTRSMPNFFNENENVTLAVRAPISLTVVDIDGNTLTLIPETPICAVITQDSNAPRLIQS